MNDLTIKLTETSSSAMDYFHKFAVESNQIEGITESIFHLQHLGSLLDFMEINVLTVEDMVKFVKDNEPYAELRDRKGLNVKIGREYPPNGGPEMRANLESVLAEANANTRHPFGVHVAYEKLHPFTDCNGRSGRALWLWQMVRKGYLYPGYQGIGFLQNFYYQSLRFNKNY